MNVKSIKLKARLTHSEKYIVVVENWENTLDNKRRIIDQIDNNNFGGAVYYDSHFHNSNITVLECVVYTD